MSDDQYPGAQMASMFMARFAERWHLTESCRKELAGLVKNILSLYDEEVRSDVNKAIESAVSEFFGIPQ